jgi:hypothetical protein
MPWFKRIPKSESDVTIGSKKERTTNDKRGKKENKMISYLYIYSFSHIYHKQILNLNIKVNIAPSKTILELEPQFKT